MRNNLLVLVAIVLFSCNNNSSSNVTEKEKILNILESSMDEENIPGLQVLVLKNNEIVFSYNLGLANVPFSVEVRDSTIFSINSIAKIFASTAILQLEEDKKLALTDSISKHIPDLPEKWHSVTIKQLLSHTSGLPSIQDPYEDKLIGGKGQDSAWVLLQKMPIEFEPGERFSYHSTNYFLIQKVIEKYSSLPFEESIKTNQFDLAGMEDIYYENSYDVRGNKSPSYAYYYQDKVTGEIIIGDKLLELRDEFPTKLRADAGAFTTANEMAKWIIALQTGKFLAEESIEKMWTPIMLNNGDYADYALGWHVINRENHPYVCAFGGGRASVSVYPKDDLAIIMFTNLSGVPTYNIGDEIAEFYY